MDTKRDLNLIIKPIIINIQTHKKYSSTPFELTKDVIYNPEIKFSGKLEKYPFFTTTVCYPQKKLIEIIQKKNGYNKIVYFFFNKRQFNKTLNRLIEKPQSTMIERDIINKNISIMLDLLFSTFYTPHNIYSIFDEKLLIDGFIDGDFKSHNSYYSSEISKYSYLNVNGNKSTIFEVIWLNHILYNPIYKSFFFKYEEFLLWSTQENTKINDEIERLYKKLKVLIEAFGSNTANDSRYVLDKYNQELNTTEKVVNDIKTRGSMRSYDNFFIDIFQRLIKQVNIIIRIIIYLHVSHSDNFKILILKNQKFYDTFEEINKIYKEGDDLDSNYRNYIKKEYFGIAFKKIFTLFKNIKNLEIIKNKYITGIDINIDYEDEDNDIIEIIKKYDYFIKFKKLIDSLKEPIRKSTNNDLQSLFNTIDDKDPNSSKNSKKEIVKLNEYFKNKKKNIHINKYLYTGLNEIDSNEKYEIFIIINIIKNVISEKNEHENKCFFKSSFLEKKLRLFFSKKINPLYISNDETYEELEEEYNNDDDDNDDDDDVNVPVKQGGAVENREIVKKDNTKILKNNPKTTNIILNISERIINTLSFL